MTSSELVSPENVFIALVCATPHNQPVLEIRHGLCVTGQSFQGQSRAFLMETHFQTVQLLAPSLRRVSLACQSLSEGKKKNPFAGMEQLTEQSL